MDVTIDTTAPPRVHQPRVHPRVVASARRRVYLPAVGLAVSAVGLVALGWTLDWGGASFGGSATALRAVLAGPAALMLLGGFLVVERVWPAQERPLVARGHKQDLLYTIVNATVLVPLVTALTLSFVAVVRRAAPWIVLPHVGWLPRAVAVVAIVVLMDACNWYVHLLNHKVRALWRFHELHHSQEDMSALTVFRTHPLIHCPYLLAAIPGIVLLANGELSITVLALYGAMVAFAHSNTRLGYGPLERAFVSPNFHRVHHLRDGPHDVNLGFTLTIWDQLAGRAVFPTPATVRADTGLRGRPLVVEQEGERPQHLRVFAQQLVAPFRPMSEATDLPPTRGPVRARGGS